MPELEKAKEKQSVARKGVNRWQREKLVEKKL
jgi:hypothetical protein